MFQFVIRFLLIFACSLSGYFIAFKYYGFPFSLLGSLCGFLVAIFVIQVEQGIRKVSLRVIFGGVLGTLTGLLIAFLLLRVKLCSVWEKQEVVPWICLLLTCILGYLGLCNWLEKKRRIHLSFSARRR